MEAQTKRNFAGNFLAVVLTGLAMLFSSIAFPPAGVLCVGILIGGGVASLLKVGKEDVG